VEARLGFLGYAPSMSVRWSASNLTTPGGQILIALPATGALTGAIVCGVALFGVAASERDAWLAAGLGAVVVFGAITALVVARTRGVAALAWDGGALRLTVRSPGRAEVSYVGPLRCEHGYVWSSVHAGRGNIRQLQLELAILDEHGRCVLFLRELLGAIYEPPPGWPQRAIAVHGAEHVLTNSFGRIDLDRLADALRPAREARSAP
jgi:hypothetical protein